MEAKRSLRLQVCPHSGGEIHIFEGSIMALIVDKERWSAVDATANSACKTRADLGQQFTIIQSYEQIR